MAMDETDKGKFEHKEMKEDLTFSVIWDLVSFISFISDLSCNLKYSTPNTKL
jgi:hypothetical protein